MLVLFTVIILAGRRDAVPYAIFHTNYKYVILRSVTTKNLILYFIHNTDIITD